MLKFIQNNREITALLAVVLLFVLPGFLDRQYLSVQTLTMVYSSAQILILLAMGATLVMLTRNIDVSVGSITGMCAVLLGMLLNAGYSLPVACVATLLLGLFAGFFNGVLVAWLKIPRRIRQGPSRRAGEQRQKGKKGLFAHHPRQRRKRLRHGASLPGGLSRHTAAAVHAAARAHAQLTPVSLPHYPEF